MRWSRVGAHSVVQLRVALLNQEFHELARRQFPWIGQRRVSGPGREHPRSFNGFPQQHDPGTEGDFELPYAADALGRLVREAMKRLAGELLREGVLSHDAHAQLLSTSAHAFRHTFGTRAVARRMPIVRISANVITDSG
jgi:integrase